MIPNGTKHLARWAKANSNWLLAALAAFGVFITAEEAVRATVKAVKVCEEKQVKGRKEIIKTVWKIYIPAVGFFLLTTVMIVGNAHINAKRLTTAAGLIALKEADLKNFKDKAKEMLGEKKVDKIEDEVERETVRKDPPPTEDKIRKTGHGNHLFREYLSGQWIRACPEWITATEEKINSAQNEDIDGVVTGGYYLDTLGADSECYVAEMEWQKHRMNELGYNRIELDVTDCQWMEVNGVQEMVSTIRPKPLPNPS